MDMENYKKSRIDNCLKQLKKVISESTNNYVNGVNECSYRVVEESLVPGYYGIRAWPDDDSIELTYACKALVYRDTGDMIASFSRSYFKIDMIAKLAIDIIDVYESQS